VTAAEVRAAMPPDMREACDALRARFGAKLIYLSAGDVKLGREVL